MNSIEWLRSLAEKGGKGVVNNVDARALGRAADEIEELRDALRFYADIDGQGKNCLLVHRIFRDPIADMHQIGHRARIALGLED